MSFEFESASESVTSNQVFTKRKAGQLDEAYKLGIKLLEKDSTDPWNIRAMAWVLVDLIKKQSPQNSALQNDYTSRLKALQIPEDDEVLNNHVGIALNFNNKNSALERKAKDHSSAGHHAQAAEIYRQLLIEDSENRSLRTKLGWEYYRLAKEAMSQSKVDVLAVKQLLNKYIQLKAERPSLLHSLFLGLADRLSGEANFNLSAFLKIWGVENVREEDFKPFRNLETGEEYTPLAEKICLHAVKQTAAQKDSEFLSVLLPLLDRVIGSANDPIWLHLAKSRALDVLGHHKESFDLAVNVTKQKMNDYWAWELLGDIKAHSNTEASLGCYCRALSLKPKEEFIGKLRLKLASILVAQGNLSEAKFEIEKVIENKLKDNYKIPSEAINFQSSSWFETTIASTSNDSLYQANSEITENLLFEHLPWLLACAGETYSLKDKPHVKRRKILIQKASNELPVDVALPENRLAALALEPGDGLKVKGETDSKGFFSVFSIEKRHAESSWDILPNKIGVVDHVNHRKELIHVIFARAVDTVIPFNQLKERPTVGDFLSVKLSKSIRNGATRYSAIEPKKTKIEPPNNVFRHFDDSVRETNGFAFSDREDIFIDPSLVKTHQISDGDNVTGRAALNHNTKRNEWGWKAIVVTGVYNDQ